MKKRGINRTSLIVAPLLGAAFLGLAGCSGCSDEPAKYSQACVDESGNIVDADLCQDQNQDGDTDTYVHHTGGVRHVARWYYFNDPHIVFVPGMHINNVTVVRGGSSFRSSGSYVAPSGGFKSNVVGRPGVSVSRGMFGSTGGGRGFGGS